MQTRVNSSAWLIAVILFIGTIPLNAQDQPNTKPNYTTAIGPLTAIEFEETTYDFGTIEEGTTVSQVFTFTNTGDEPLILTEAKGSCGCTVPQWPAEPIMPGETASLTVEFNSKNKRGQRNQRVTITTNTEPAQTFLYLKGEVFTSDENNSGLTDFAIREAETKVDPDCFAIYPNPTAEILKLTMDENNLGKSAIISIFAPSGQLMAKREVKTISGTVEFNVAHYPAGTYVAKVQVGERKPEARCFVVMD